ncbi:fumarate hydratase C-terminal domain-containing protein [Cupriavidus basilensis]
MARLWLRGRLLTARDAAHKRLVAMLDAGEPLPVRCATARSTTCRGRRGGGPGWSHHGHAHG